MTTSRRARALTKLQAVEHELFEAEAEVLERRIVNRNRIRIALTSLLFLSMMLLIFLIVTGQLPLVYEPTPSSIAFGHAETDGHGKLRVFVDTPAPDPLWKMRSFDRVSARLLIGDSREQYKGEVIPIFLKNGRIRFLIQFETVMQKPGGCDLRLHLKGWTKKSNEIRISQLSAAK